ncbi:MAG: c-type cytochrome [Flavobacteriales bacterium]|nr:c-type cytochrome [Flavobacteriales bacterium]
MKKYILFLLVGAIAMACGPDGDDGPDPVENEPHVIDLPSYFGPLVQPLDNEATVKGVELGRFLFFEQKLSADNTLSCAGCHLPAAGFADPNPTSTGIDGIDGTRNAMAIINLAYRSNGFFWDGRSATLEIQAEEPVPNPIEMHQEWPEALSKLRNDPLYPPMFKSAFGDTAITVDRVTKAIAQFERTLISGNSKFDRFLRGEVELTPSEIRGFDTFENETSDCFHCHGTYATAFQFTDNAFHNNGLDSVWPPSDPGLNAITGDPNDLGLFHTPTLRNIEFTGPYMHDGRFETLEEVIEFYNMGGHPSPTIDPNMKAAGVGRNWTQQQKDDLIAFLKTLSDPEFINDPDHSDPH